MTNLNTGVYPNAVQASNPADPKTVIAGGSPEITIGNLDPAPSIGLNYLLPVYNPVDGSTTKVSLTVLAAVLLGTTGLTPMATAAAGLPTYNIGFYQDALQGNSTSGNGYDANIDNQILQTGMNPGMVLVFPGTFNSIDDVVYRYNQEAAAWKNNVNLNGTKRPIPIPVIGVSGQYTNGGMTHRSVLTGAYDTQLKQIVTAWAGANVPELWARLNGWEIDYPTTPDGQGAQNGAFGSGATANSNDVAFCPEYRAAFRYMARIMRAQAQTLGLKFRTIWEPATISSCQIDPRLMFPDNDVSDGYGKQVDINGNDFYWNNFYGPTVQVLHTGYDLAPPMTPFASTGTTSDIPTWAQDKGSLYYYSDFTDGNNSDPYGWGGGWSMYEAINFAANCPFGPNPIMHPEMGGVTGLDGGHNGGLTVTSPDGPAGSHEDGGPFFSPYQAGYIRRTWGYAQSQGVEVLGACLWFYQSNRDLQTFAAAFPEKTNGYVGSTLSPVAAPIPRISVVQPEYHAKPGVPFTIRGAWALRQPSALDISFDGGTTFGPATGAVIGADRSITYSHTFPSAGANYRLVLRDTANPTVLGKTNNFSLQNVGQAYTQATAAMYPGANPFRMTAKIEPTTLSAGGNQFILALWPNAANLAYAFYIDTNGNLNALYVDAAGNYIGSPSTAALPASIISTPLWVRATVTSSTGAVLYETSSDGSTWTQLGTTITNSLTSAVNGAGLAAGSFISIGGCEGGGNVFQGAIYEVKLEVSGAAVFDFNFATQSVSTSNASVDSVGNVWTVYSPVVSNVVAPAVVQQQYADGPGKTTTLTFANAASATNMVVAFAGNYSSGNPGVINTTDVPAGFTLFASNKLSNNASTAGMFGLGSKLASGDTALTIVESDNITGNAGIGMLEIAATKAAGDVLVTTTGTGSLTAQVKSQGGTNPLRLGAVYLYVHATDGTFSASGGTILHQSNTGNVRIIFFTQNSAAPVQLTHSAGAAVNDVNGVGLELTA